MANTRRDLYAGLSIDVVDHGGARTVRLAGEVDLATSARLRDALSLAALDGGDVTVDLADVTFADSHLGHALIDFHADQSSRGDRLRVVNIPPRVWRLFVLARFADTLELEESSLGSGCR